jgi:hypothetical protein
LQVDLHVFYLFGSLIEKNETGRDCGKYGGK